MAVYGPVRHQKNSIWTEAYMAVYGPVSHQKNIILTEAYMAAYGPFHILPYDPK
jgi:hypothetical protein